MVAISYTDHYVDDFNKNNNCTSVTKWMHNHPTAVKVMQIAACILGIAALATIPFSLPILGIAIVGTIAACAAISLVASLTTWLFLKYLTCDTHKLSEHVFQEAECAGGRLYYRGNIPILELDGNHPLQAGQAHGYLLGAHIHELRGNFELTVHSILRYPRAPEVTNVLNQLRAQIPKSYLQEMEGLSRGYNLWAKEAKISSFMTLDDLILMHLIADAKHFHPKQIERAIGQIKEESDLKGAVACTSLLHRDPENGVVFGRNVDWCPFGQGGAKSLILVWKPQNIAVLGIPGVIGAITGWNQHRLSAAMNVCPGDTSEVRGMPSMLFNRQVLEQSRSVKEAEEWVQKKRPLGPYHLTLADAEGGGSCISFYQGDQEQDYIRRLKGDEPMLVVNWRYPECKGGAFSSTSRTELLNRYFERAAALPEEQRQWRKLMDNAIQLTPLVNSWVTMHSLFFVPKHDEVSLSWDNGYAASTPREKISMSEVFTDPRPSLLSPGIFP